MIDIDKLINDSPVEKGNLERSVYRLVKAKLLEYKTSKEAVNKPLTDAIEANILRKMVSERKEDAKMYELAQRYEQASQELAEARIIEALLPPEIDEATINKTLDEYVAENGDINQKAMGAVMKYVKAKLPTADGKTVSTLVKARIV